MCCLHERRGLADRLPWTAGSGENAGVNAVICPHMSSLSVNVKPGADIYSHV